MPIETLSELFLTTASYGIPDCLIHKTDGEWRKISTDELLARVRGLSGALAELGIERGDRVGLMADNGPHWPTVDFATLCIGGILVPIYPTLPPEQAAYIAEDSGAKVMFVEGRERLEGLLERRDEMPAVETFVLIESETSGSGAGDTTLEALLASEHGMDPDTFETTARQTAPDDLATFIYTSGTTGKPKGVMLTHGNIATNIVKTLEVLDIESGRTALSFLPLSHSFERSVDYVYFYRGVSIAYAESVQTVGEDMRAVRPHFFVAVPRVYEKVQARIHENVAQGSSLKQKIFGWAVDVGRQTLPYRLAQESPGPLLSLKAALADKLVFGKIRDRLGGRFEFAISGGAPLGAELARFFWGAGIPIFEGYGLTETSPVLTVNGPGRVKLGTVGRPIPDTEIRIAEDGEILARGPQVMQGYYNLPEETAAAIDEDGWFYTGDIGELDDDGYLSITDRKKQIIVTAYGKNIAPAPIENELKTSRFIGEAVVIGDQRKFLSALLVPDFEALESWANSNDVSFSGREELVEEDRVRSLYEEEVTEINRRFGKQESIKAWELVPQEFTIEGGELTPTQKVKRRVIHDKYEDLIDRIYERAEERHDG